MVIKQVNRRSVRPCSFPPIGRLWTHTTSI